MRTRLASVTLAAIAMYGGCLNAQERAAAVRPEEPALREVIALGTARSATFRELASRLDSSDVVVYVRLAPCVGKVASCMLWASEAGGTRRLLIKLDRFGRSLNELAALLGHELQHANEVADAPEIRDPVSFRNAFVSRGSKHAAGFETEAAAAAGRRVSVELARR